MTSTIPIPSQDMAAGHKVATNIFPPPTIPPAVGFVCEPAESPHCVLSFQHSVVVRAANIGAQMLVGILRDREEPVEDQIVYGLSLNAGQVRALENSLSRSLFEQLESGRTVSSLCEWGRDGGWKRLLWLNEIRPDPNSRTLAQDSSCLPGAHRHGLSQQAAQAQTRREAVLALRKRWSLADATSRADIPNWLPKFALEIVMDTSAWAALPESAPATRPRR